MAWLDLTSQHSPDKSLSAGNAVAPRPFPRLLHDAGRQQPRPAAEQALWWKGRQRQTGADHALSTGHSALLCRTSSVQGTECQPPGSRCLLAFVPEQDGWRFAVFALFGFLRVYRFSGSAPSPRPLTHPVCDRRVFLSRASEETSFSSTPTSFSRVRST